MPQPYYTESAHDVGPITNTAGNGVRDTAIANTEGRLVIDMADNIFVLDVKVSPFTSLITSNGRTWDGKTLKGQALRKRVVENPTFSELEDNIGGTTTRVGAGGYAASGAVTITVGNAGTTPAYIYTPGDVVLNTRTGERMLVATVATSTTITVAAAGRAFGTTAAAAGLGNDTLLIIGNVNEQFAFARNVNNTRSTKVDNYTQTFRISMGASNTEMASKLYGGPDMAHQRAKKGIEHQRSIERAFHFGEKKSTTGAQGHPMFATGGLQEFIEATAYVQDQNGPLTAPDMEVFLREGFTYGAPEKLLECGARTLSALSEICRGQLLTTQGADTYGVKIQKWVSPHGDVNIVHNPLFTEDFSGWAFLLDLDCFRYAVMSGRDTKLKTNIQANDADGQVDEFITECGLERIGAARCALMKGVV
jgi:hypothetical protein